MNFTPRDLKCVSISVYAKGGRPGAFLIRGRRPSRDRTASVSTGAFLSTPLVPIAMFCLPRGHRISRFSSAYYAPLVLFAYALFVIHAATMRPPPVSAAGFFALGDGAISPICVAHPAAYTPAKNDCAASYPFPIWG